jgi:DNA-binding transcriptional ArsR family regulator
MEKKAAVKALAALAHDTRLALFRRLVRAGPSGLPAGTLAESLGVKPNTLSFHLSHLANAGLVIARREGRSIIYSAAFDRMDALMAYLTRHCCADEHRE